MQSLRQQKMEKSRKIMHEQRELLNKIGTSPKPRTRVFDVSYICNTFLNQFTSTFPPLIFPFRSCNDPLSFQQKVKETQELKRAQISRKIVKDTFRGLDEFEEKQTSTAALRPGAVMNDFR